MPHAEGRSRWLLGAGLVLLAGCRIETDRGEAATPSFPVPVDTLRADCPERLPVVRPARRPVGRDIVRILSARDGILLATPEGLFRVAGKRMIRLLPPGRDWALAEGVLARLGEGRIDVFEYGPGETPERRARLPAGRHEASVALAAGDLFVHSAFNDDALVHRRSLEGGAVVGRALPVERDLVRTLLGDPARLHEDEGILVSEADLVVHVPSVRDPVTILEVAPGAGRVLELADGRRGVVRVEGERRRDARPCRFCVRRVEIGGRVIVAPLYAAAALAEGILWVVRLDPPGSSGGVLLRTDVQARRVHAWRLVLPGRPTAMAIVGDTLALAAERDLWLAARPATATAAPCVLR